MESYSTLYEKLVDWCSKEYCVQEKYPYGNITVHTPPSIYIDKTVAAEKYHDDFNSQQLSRAVEATNNKDVINVNILCQWGCPGSVLQSGKVPMDLILQKLLS